MKKGDIVYFARVVPNLLYEVLELKIRTVAEDWFVGTDKDSKHAHLLDNSSIDNYVFYDRKKAVKYVVDAEKMRTRSFTEIE